MQSTFVTFGKVCIYHKIPKTDWDLDGKYNVIRFKNGSTIDLLDVKYLPTDPMFERFGSLEYTGGWLEEAGETHFLAFDVLKSRVGRHKNKEFGLLGKIFITCNPNKEWLYRIVYKPFKEGTLSSDFAFIQSLYKDNTYTADEYEGNLSRISDKVTKERLMFGNWEYGSQDGSLMSYNSILDLFTNTVDEDDKKYLVADIARFGSDHTVISKWKGLECYEIKKYHHLSTDQVRDKIREEARLEQIPFSRICVDEDGIGGGVVDGLPGIKGFIANSTPIQRGVLDKENFFNLKTQCAYELAKLVTLHQISAKITDESIKQEVIQDLEQIKRYDGDKEGKLRIRPKDEVKEVLGRSPDVGDVFIMRMLFQMKREEFRPLGLTKNRSFV